MSSSSNSQTPKAQVLSKVSHLQGAAARTATDKAWAENTVKMLYRRNVQPPVSQPHADLLMAEEQWFEACKNHDYPWSGHVNTNGTSEPRHSQYFHYWFERKQLDEQASVPVAEAEGEIKPLLTADKHDLAWQKVLAQEKGVLSKTTKKQLVELYEGVKQQIREAERLAWEGKKSAVTIKERVARKLEAERKEHHATEHKYRKLKYSLQRGDYGDWGEQLIVKSDADEQQRLIQANHIQALEGKFDMKADTINESLDENRELKLKLSRAEAKIITLEKENDELMEKFGKVVKVKKEEQEPAMLKLEDVWTIEMDHQEDQEEGSRKRKYEDVSSDDAGAMSEDEI
ncbi:hypothetical protein PG985_014362 [Apiospora marii]|uniref:Uncharacterized protein n=1 Tax=Apiospora marii TaxID=335849 RepID=A0ABR1R5E5_9PEZI